MYNEPTPVYNEDYRCGGRRVMAGDDLAIHEKYLQEVLRSDVLFTLYEYPANA